MSGPVVFTCPEHGDDAVFSIEDGEAFCIPHEDVIDVDLPDVRMAIAQAADRDGHPLWVHTAVDGTASLTDEACPFCFPLNETARALAEADR